MLRQSSQPITTSHTKQTTKKRQSNANEQPRRKVKKIKPRQNESARKVVTVRTDLKTYKPEMDCGDSDHETACVEHAIVTITNTLLLMVKINLLANPQNYLCIRAL